MAKKSNSTGSKTTTVELGQEVVIALDNTYDNKTISGKVWKIDRNSEGKTVLFLEDVE